MLLNEALARDIAQCRPAPCACAFWWLGQIGFAVKTASATLYFDLFLSELNERLFPPPLRAELIADADIVFGSHDHIDHIDDPVWRAVAQRSPQARFALPAGLAEAVSGRLGIPRERMLPLGDGQTVEVGGVTVSAIATAHEKLNDRNENVGFIVRADGVTICHLGDTCVYEGLVSKLKAAGPIDLLILPINGRDARRLHRGCLGNMTFQEAVDLVGEVRPRLAVPAHYEMIEGNTEDPYRFAAYLEIKYPERDFWIGPHATRVTLPGASEQAASMVGD